MDLEAIKALSNEALAEQIAAYSSTLDGHFAVENPTPDQFAAAKADAETLDALEAERDSRAAAASGMDTLRAARQAKADFAAKDEESDEDPDDEDDEDDPEDEEPEEEQEEEAAETEEAVTASSTPRRSARANAARNAERPPAPTKAPVVITASADVPGFATGSQIESLSDVAKAVRNRAKGFPQFSGGRGFSGDSDGIRRFAVAQFGREFPEELIATGNNDQEVMEFAGRETRLPGGSLTAAGGWCAPSETLYDLCQPETTDGLLSLPEFQVTRGGIRTTKGPDFSDVFDAVGNIYTEAESIAGVTKTCYEVDCPPFEETRLDAVYTCIKVPLLQNAAYPELTENVLARAMIAHQHKVSASMITRIVTALGTALSPTGLGAVSTDTLEALELAANYRRQQYRIGMAATMEGFAPFWVKGAIRADLARRNGMDVLSVTDAQIDGYLAARNIRLQWIYNWQPLADGVAYPETVDVAMYPAGSFSKGVEDVISLDAVYDAASLQENKYTGLFFEEGVLLADNCMTGDIVTIPICTAGRSGAADQTCVVAAG